MLDRFKRKNEGDDAAKAPERPVVKHLRWRASDPEMRTPRVSNEAQVRRIVVLGTIGAFILTGLLIGAAVLQMFVVEPNRAVATVGGTNITRNDLQRRVRLDYVNLINRYQQIADTVQQAQSQSATSDTSGFLVQYYQQQLQQVSSQIDGSLIANNSLDSLIGDQLLRQEARARGIVVNADDVQLQLEKEYGYYRVPLTPLPVNTPAPAPTAAPGATAVPPAPTALPQAQPTSISSADLQTGIDRGVEYFKAAGESEADFRSLFELRVIETRLREEIGKDVPVQDEHYRFDYLRFNAEQDALNAVAQLNAKTVTFEALISTTNALTVGVTGNGETVDWTWKKSVEQRYAPEVASSLANAGVGAITTAFSPTINSFYVLRLDGKAVRPLSQSDRDAAQKDAFDAWLSKAREDATRVSFRITTPEQYVPRNVRDAITSFKQNQQP